MLLIDGVDEYVPPVDTAETVLSKFLSEVRYTRKLVGVSLRYGADYSITRNPIIESGDEEKRLTLGGIRTNSQEQDEFLKAFFALPRDKSKLDSEERVRTRLKLPSFRLEQIDLMTVSLLATKGKLQSVKTLTELFGMYCSNWASSLGVKSPAQVVQRASEMAFDFAIRGQLPGDIDLANDPCWRLIHTHETIKDYLIAEYVVGCINRLSMDAVWLQRLDYVYPKPISRFFSELMQHENFKASQLLDNTTKLFRSVEKHELPASYTKLRDVLCFLLGRLKDENVVRLAKSFLKRCIPTIEAEMNGGNSQPLVDRTEQTIAHRQNMLLLRTIYVSRIYLKEVSASDEYIEKLLKDYDWCSLNRGFHLEYYGDITFEPREYMLHSDNLEPWTSTYHYLYNKACSMLDKNSGYEDLTLYTLFSLAQHRHAISPIDEDKRQALLSLGKKAVDRTRIHSVKLRAYLKMMIHNLERFSTFAPARALKQMYHLKFEPRAGWVKRGSQHPESVADHSYGACLLCMIMLPDTPKEDWEAYNKQKVLRLLFAHDFIEAYTGDFLPEEKGHETELHEERAVEYVEMLSTYPVIEGVSELAALWREFNEKATRDARVAGDIDKLENLAQLFVLRSGRAAAPLWTLPTRQSPADNTRPGKIADFEDFKTDLIKKIKTGPGQYLLELITNAFEV